VTDRESGEYPSVEELAASIGDGALALGARVAVAESLTSGAIATLLGAAPNASDWFAGAVVAYDSEIKFSLLGVDRGPVVTEQCARQMATGLRSLMSADFTAAITGVGGPGPSEGVSAGTVYLATSSKAAVLSWKRHLAGDPATVVETAVRQTLAELANAINQA
jgi:nicotinamide-nucleotide amidase